MKPNIHLVAMGVMAAALSMGVTACSADRERADADREMDTTADRMMPDSPRRHDAQQSTGAASGPVTGATSGERAGNRTDDNTQPHHGADRADAAVAPADRSWAMKAAQGGIAEVELGELAQKKGSSAQVKNFGTLMVEDHSEANEKLKQIASGKGIDLPGVPGAEHKKVMNRLSKLSGESFDRAYLEAMQKEHNKDIAHFEKGSIRLNDPELKEFASNTLPKMKEHLNQLQSIRGNMRGQADRQK
jgi:putative membrane protein